MGGPPPPPVEWEQRLGEVLPLQETFRLHTGETLALGELFDGRPVVLALVYYECPMLCNMILDGLVRALDQVSFDAGDEYRVVALSIDPGETPELAAAKRDAYLEAYGREVAFDDWSFLVGDEPAIRRVAETVGYEYTYVAETGEYAHGAGITILTPEGVVSRVLLGIEYEPRDVRLALVEASEGNIGTVVDQFLLRCFHYDPARGKYGLAILNTLRGAGLATVAILAIVVIRLLRRERRFAFQPEAAS